MTMTKRFPKMTAALGALTIAGGALALGIFTEPGVAQQAPAAATPATAPAPSATSETPAAPATTAAPASPANPAKADKFLSLSEIADRISSEGLRVTELEVHDRVVEVEGRDASNRKVELMVDRRSGEILSRKLDD